jgi:hypothetical protein
MNRFSIHEVYFSIEHEQVAPCAAALNAWFEAQGNAIDETHPENIIAGILSENGWDVEFNDAGDLVDIGRQHDGMSLIDTENLFCVLAPFVDEESYIHASGEDFMQWRWLFREGKLWAQDGHTVFENSEPALIGGP